MDKIYKFEVRVPKLATNIDSIATSLLREAQEDKRQYELSKSINEKISDAHKQVIRDVLEEFSELLTKLGIEHINHDVSWRTKSLNYQKSYGCIEMSGRYLNVVLIPQVDNDFKDSEYTTYKSDYTLRYNLGSKYSPNNTDYYEYFESIEEIVEKEKTLLIKLINE